MEKEFAVIDTTFSISQDILRDCFEITFVFIVAFISIQRA